MLKDFVTGSRDGKPVGPLLGNIKDYDGGNGGNDTIPDNGNGTTPDNGNETENGGNESTSDGSSTGSCIYRRVGLFIAAAWIFVLILLLYHYKSIKRDRL